MRYTFDFSGLLAYAPTILWGILTTIELIVIGGIIGVLLGIACAWARTQGPRWLRPPVTAYVELIRNTPFLIQLFFIFFGLPAAGVSLGETPAAILTIVINLGAYSCEIIRAGIQATHKGQFEAGASLAMSPFQTFRHVVLVPALQKIWPALSSQMVIVMLGTSVCSQISVEEITFAANYIQSRTFRAFEVYILATLLYLLLSVLLRQVLRGIGVVIFPRRRAVR